MSKNTTTRDDGRRLDRSVLTSRRTLLAAIGVGTVGLAAYSSVTVRDALVPFGRSEGEPEPNLFFDDFESGSMAREDILTLEPNEDGFYWGLPGSTHGGNNRTSVVQDEWPDGGRVIWNDGELDTFVEGRDWRARTGRRSLRFRYPANESWAEQRFVMNDDDVGYPEVWFSFWIRVPPNFSYASGDGGPASDNDKWLAIYMDDYSVHGSGSTAVYNLWPSRDEEAGSARTSLSASPAERDDRGSYGHTDGLDDFMVPSRDRGRWMRSVHRLTTNSAPGKADAEMQWWRRWEDDDEFELVAEKTDYVFSPPADSDAPQGWNKGYLLGWSNGTYAEDTEFLVQDVGLSTEPLIDGVAE